MIWDVPKQTNRNIFLIFTLPFESQWIDNLQYILFWFYLEQMLFDQHLLYFLYVYHELSSILSTCQLLQYRTNQHKRAFLFEFSHEKFDLIQNHFWKLWELEFRKLNKQTDYFLFTEYILLEQWQWDLADMGTHFGANSGHFARALRDPKAFDKFPIRF